MKEPNTFGRRSIVVFACFAVLGGVLAWWSASSGPEAAFRSNGDDVPSQAPLPPPQRGNHVDESIVQARSVPSEPKYPVLVPVYHPRDKSEWQGMLVDVSSIPPCNGGTLCGLAQACIDDACRPCERDAQCENGEACVLDHCLLANLVECRKTKDCRSGEICVLSGYAPGPRGNEGMRSYCLDEESGTNPPDVEPEPEPVAAAPVHSPRSDAFRRLEKLVATPTRDELQN